MSMKRFETIIKAMRYDDAETREECQEQNKLAPIQELWDSILQKCGANWIPGHVLTVDKQFVKFRGRCGFRMFIPTKPGKYDIKVFMVCDADKLYCINGFPYKGKGSVDGELSRGKYN